MVSGEDAKLKVLVFTSVHTWPVAVLVKVIVIVTTGLQPIVVLSTYVLPENDGGVPQLEVQLTEVIAQPPRVCDVLFMVMVLLPFNPQATL